jgi:HEAT repeat protein
LYREARRALSSDSHRRAADLFRAIHSQHPRSTYAADALYYEAFALQRLGTRDDLTRALAALESHAEKFPRASTRGDANALRTRVEGLLARQGDQGAIDRLAQRAANATQDGCPREQDDDRIAALNALVNMDVDQATPTLKRMLDRREPCTQKIRKTAVMLLGSRRPADAPAILLNVAKNDPDREVREQAVFWMGNVPSDEATSTLIELAKRGDDLEMRKRAVYALSRSKSPRAAATLREIALDSREDVEVRMDALNWYASTAGKNGEDVIPFLREVYGKSDEVKLRQRVLQSIAQRRTDDARALLTEVAQNTRESMEMRRSAIWSLQSSGATPVQLAQIYDRTPEVEIRKQLVSTLQALRNDAGIEKLIDIARNEKNVEIRKQAINGLQRSKDPRALAVLTEIINK